MNRLGPTLSLLSLLFRPPPASAADPTWSFQAPMPFPRATMAAGVVNRTIYCVGGDNGTVFVTTNQAYDVLTNTWSVRAPMPTARGYINNAAQVVNGILYVFGGTDGTVTLTTVEAYDPVTDIWSTKAPMPTARGDVSTAVYGGLIYVFGGFTGFPAWTNAVEAYDPASNTWTTRAPMFVAKEGTAAVVSGTRIYVMGGWDGFGPVANADAYNPAANSWSAATTMPTARADLGGADPTGLVWAVGGSTASVVLDTVESFNPGGGGWTTKSPLGLARNHMGVVAVGCVLYAIGGYPGVGVTGVVERGIPSGLAAALGATLFFPKSPVSVGQPFQVELHIDNLACPDITNLLPTLSLLPGGGTAILVSGPSPASSPFLANGDSTTFTWTFTATGAGWAAFSGTGTGFAPATSATVLAAAAGALLIQAPAALAGAIAVSPATVYAGDAILVTLTVSDTGEADAVGVRPPPLPRWAGTATAFKAAGPTPAGPVSVTGGGMRTFTWVFTAGPNTGTMTFTGSATGFDANSGTTLLTGSVISGVVTVIAPPEPCPSMDTRIVSYDNFFGNLDDIGYGITVSPGGTIFLAATENADYFTRFDDIVVVGYPPGGGSQFTFHEAYSAGSVSDQGYAVARLANGTHVAVGTLGNGPWLACDDEAGAAVWSLTPAPAAGGPDDARAVAADPVSGGFYAAGRVRRADLGQGDNVWLARYTAGGVLVWAVTYNSPANGDDAAFGVAVDPSGSIYVAGYETRTDLGQGKNILLLKYSATGVVLWAATANAPANGDDEALAVAVDAQGRAVLGGFETRTDLGQGENGWVRAFNTDGTARWTATCNGPLLRTGGPNDRIGGLAIDPGTGDVFATGRMEQPGGRKADLMFRRWNAAGTLLEAAVVNGPNNGDDEGHAIVIGPGGDLYVAGVEDWNNLGEHLNAVVHRWSRPGCLMAELRVIPTPASVGQGVTITLTVTNNGGTAVTGLLPDLGLAPPAGIATLAAGPGPASVASLAAGTSTTFTWTYSAVGPGLVRFTGTVTGTHAGTGLPVAASAAATLLVQSAAALAAAASIPGTACLGQVVVLRVTVTNTGQAAASGVGTADPPLVTGTATLYGGATLAGPVTLAGGATTTFIWAYTVTGAGTALFSVTVTGTDANSGSALVAGPVVAGPLTTGVPAALVAAAAWPALVPVGGVLAVSLTVTNDGAGPANAVAPAVALVPPGAPVAVRSAPAPLTLPPGGATTFTWTWSVSGWGSVAFTLTAAGTDFCGPALVSATTGTVLLGTPTALVASLVSAGPTLACLGTPLTVVVSVTNTGQVPADPLAGLPLFVEGSAVPVGAAPSVAVLAGGASAHLTWTYSATAAGTLRFTATITALDQRSGAMTFVGPITTPLLTESAPAVLVAAVNLPATPVAGQVITVRLTVTNTGGQDAVNVSATRFAATLAGGGAAASVLSGPLPAGPVTLAPGMAQVFTWTYSVAGAGGLTFSFTAGGETCGTPPVPIRGVGTGFAFVLAPANLVATSLLLSPAAARIGWTFTATLTLRNTGGEAAWVSVLTRTAAGIGNLGPPSPPVPLTSFLIAGGAPPVTVTWVQVAVAPCGLAYALASVSGTGYVSGLSLQTGTVFSNPVGIAGVPAGLTLAVSAGSAAIGSPVTLKATVVDSCGVGVPGEPVDFSVLAGGGLPAAPTAFTNAAGVATMIFTLGPDLGMNAVAAAVASAALSATVEVTGTSTLTLLDPGAALDRNVVDTGAGEFVIARIFPHTKDPIVVRIFTASGRLVRTLRVLTPLGRDQYTARWDGMTEDGFRVARGVYLIRVDGGGIGVTMKVIVK